MESSIPEHDNRPFFVAMQRNPAQVMRSLVTLLDGGLSDLLHFLCPYDDQRLLAVPA